MFFGMTNSPPTFQNMMNDILKDIIDKGIVIVFIDNILIFMEDEEHHDEIVEEVLKRLKENDLFLKPEKCEFKKEIEFLGMIIGEKGVKMDSTKVEAIMSWPTLKHMKNVQAFLGLTNFYHQFIQKFSKIATPLHNLMHKETVWRWGGTQQKAFDELKRRFVEGPILVATNYTCPLCMELDTLDFATGAVLLMLCEDEKWHLCAFLSKGLNDVKRNYNMHDKEMLGIIQALEMWRHYLEGAKHEIDIWTDHQNLKYFMSAKKLNL